MNKPAWKSAATFSKTEMIVLAKARPLAGQAAFSTTSRVLLSKDSCYKYFLAYCTSSSHSNVTSYQFHIFPYHQSHLYTKDPLLTWLDHLPNKLLSPWSLDTVSLGQITHFLATSYRGLLMVYYVERLLESAAHILDLWGDWTHTDVYATLSMRHPSYPKEYT